MSSSQGHDDASLTIDPLEGERKRCVLDQFHGFPFSSDEAFQVRLPDILPSYFMAYCILARSFWNPGTRVNESDA